MEKGDSFSFRADPRYIVDKLNSRPAAPLERSVQIVDRKADVMEPRASLRDEAGDRRVGISRFQQLDERATGVEPGNPRPVGIIQLDLGEAENVAKKRQARTEGLYGDPDMGNPDSARGCWVH